MSQQRRITFQPHGRTVFVLDGTKLLEAAARTGLTIETPCGGLATCGKCRVQVTTGACTPDQHEQELFSREELAAGWRLACQTTVRGDTVVHIPDSSLFAGRHQIFVEARTGAAEEVLPAVRKQYVELPEATLDDTTPDLMRLEKVTGPLKTDLGMLQRLGSVLRRCEGKGTAVLSDHHLLDFEPGDTTGQCYGMAFDIGTTTVVGSLVDLADGRELAIASAMNPQISFGDDVLSRIERSGSGQASADEMQTTIVGAVGGLIEQLCDDAGVDRRQVYELAFAGNTTMEHLLCGLDVTQLGQVPFVPIHGRGLMLRAEQLALDVHRNAALYVFPVIGGFVGGDTVAGILTAKLTEAAAPVLMIDIGTNGEIVLCHDGRLSAASTAAGPAFEGARISCGMRATTGAIEKVVLDDDVNVNVIANAEPIGLCGSGLIDLAADMLDAGLITREGRLLGPDELPSELPAAIAGRVAVNGEGQTEFLIAGDADGRGVRLNQRDVRELQLATGAIHAGVNILLKQAHLVTGDLEQVLIAGGFGSFIRRSKAQRIGLLPSDVDRRKIRYIGNASLNGARWALLSTPARKRAEEIARMTQHVELSRDTNFQMEFAEAMIFPE
jgi:uncharacterized 2Fe-2S/4Fe-4S cluster protein (DUF4445 family)